MRRSPAGFCLFGKIESFVSLCLPVSSAQIGLAATGEFSDSSMLLFVCHTLSVGIFCPNWSCGNPQNFLTFVCLLVCDTLSAGLSRPNWSSSQPQKLRTPFLLCVFLHFVCWTQQPKLVWQAPKETGCLWKFVCLTQLLKNPQKSLSSALFGIHCLLDSVPKIGPASRPRN